jgi:hypothetical protein
MPNGNLASAVSLAGRELTTTTRTAAAASDKEDAHVGWLVPVWLHVVAAVTSERYGRLMFVGISQYVSTNSRKNSDQCGLTRLS